MFSHMKRAHRCICNTPQISNSKSQSIGRLLILLSSAYVCVIFRLFILFVSLPYILLCSFVYFLYKVIRSDFLPLRLVFCYSIKSSLRTLLWVWKIIVIMIIRIKYRRTFSLNPKKKKHQRIYLPINCSNRVFHFPVQFECIFFASTCLCCAVDVDIYFSVYTFSCINGFRRTYKYISVFINQKAKNSSGDDEH